MILDFQKQKWYFLSSSIKKRKSAFLNPKIRRTCFQSFLTTAQDNSYLLAIFVLMPEHFHILSGTKDLYLSKEKIAKNYKGASSRRIFLSTPNLKMDMKSHFFWTDGCDKCEINDYSAFMNIFRYIYLNPNKKKLLPQFYSLYINKEFSGPEFIQGTENYNFYAPNEFGA